MLYLDQVRAAAKFLSAEEEHGLAVAASKYLEFHVWLTDLNKSISLLAERCRTAGHSDDALSLCAMIESAEAEARKVSVAIAKARAARERLICSQLPWVINLAKKYQGRGIALEDLVQLGNEGLVHAADKFDPMRRAPSTKRGKVRYIRFGTYATWWIKQVIRHELDTKVLVIRIPTKDNRNRRGKTQAQTDVVYAALAGAVRVDGGHFLQPAAPEPHRDEVDAAEELERVRFHLPSLPDKFRYIIERRMAGDTLKAIGRQLGVTREAIRQMEGRAMVVLRRKLGVAAPPRAKPARA